VNIAALAETPVQAILRTAISFPTVFTNVRLAMDRAELMVGPARQAMLDNLPTASDVEQGDG
jgi:hypothetical protein